MSAKKQIQSHKQGAITAFYGAADVTVALGCLFIWQLWAQKLCSVILPVIAVWETNEQTHFTDPKLKK